MNEAAAPGVGCYGATVLIAKLATWPLSPCINVFLQAMLYRFGIRVFGSVPDVCLCSAS